MGEFPKRLSCGIVPVHEGEQGRQLLMLRAWRNWDFPKGLRESGEAPLEAALRELREETGISDVHLDWGEAFLETGPYSRNKTARYYLARTDRTEVVLPVAPGLGRPEHHEFRWVDPATARRLASPRVRTVIDWALSQMGM